MIITSNSNAKVKQIIQWRDKSRDRRNDGVFLVEGVKMFEEAPEDGILEVYVAETAIQKLTAVQDKPITDKLNRHAFITVKDDVFVRMSDTQTPQGIITVMRRREYDADQMLSSENPLLVVLETLQDPGNLGTIIRTGEGAGVTGIIMNSKTVDIYNPKTIRATMGSIYRVPFAYVDDLDTLMVKLKEKGIHTYAAHLEGTDYYDNLSFRQPTAFLIGNEGNGLTRELAKRAERYLKIPMEGQVESLNAAIAASLLMYEAHRQRRK